MLVTFILLRKGESPWLKVSSRQVLQLRFEETCCQFSVSRNGSSLSVYPRSSYNDQGRREELSNVAASSHLMPIFCKSPLSWEKSPNIWDRAHYQPMRPPLKTEHPFKWYQVLSMR